MAEFRSSAEDLIPLAISSVSQSDEWKSIIEMINQEKVGAVHVFLITVPQFPNFEAIISQLCSVAESVANSRCIWSFTAPQQSSVSLLPAVVRLIRQQYVIKLNMGAFGAPFNVQWLLASNTKRLVRLVKPQLHDQPHSNEGSTTRVDHDTLRQYVHELDRYAN